jgi:hypothetical protein
MSVREGVVPIRTMQLIRGKTHNERGKSLAKKTMIASPCKVTDYIRAGNKLMDGRCKM